MICFYCCLRILFSEIINVELPSNPPPEYIYTLDVDPIDREYTCLDGNNNNNNNTEWQNGNLQNEGQFLNIYSFYEANKMKGIAEFRCYNSANKYVGSMMVNIVGK